MPTPPADDRDRRINLSPKLSALPKACDAGGLEQVRQLIERGEEVSPSNLTIARREQIRVTDTPQPRGKLDAYQIPIFCASWSGSAECVRLLLDAGASPNERDCSAVTPLMVARSATVVDLLLKSGADLLAIDCYGNDALDALLHSSDDDEASEQDLFDVAQSLIAAGIDVDRTERHFGGSRLGAESSDHHDDAVAFLLKLGASVAPEATGETPLHAICWQGEYNDPEKTAACKRIIETLVGAGADPNAADDRGSTPMHEAASGDWGNPTAIRTLLQFGAKPDAPDENGDTPLLLAAKTYEPECVVCVQLLLDAGADPGAKNKVGCTAIEEAQHLRKGSKGPPDHEYSERLCTIIELLEIAKARKRHD